MKKLKESMVCEAPRHRSLFVSRRGQFFEDPFFRDAWADYNHAVRRIVDRFNYGWVQPSSRIRDSQYHSMYRTLRTARLNYATHSARFKDDGNKYKLVMDVHEFIGGDLTVRTAGSTVSVRGKLEAGAPETKETSLSTKGGDDDTSSVSSGMSSSSRTLHRRFTLPADADCEKVESSLSQDAVLTVTIPKRKDVHYIPVTIEGEGSQQISSEKNERYMNRLGGIKRPSDSANESNRKKSQDESSTSIAQGFDSSFGQNALSKSRETTDSDSRRTRQNGSRRSRYDTFYGNRHESNSDPRKRTYEESKGSIATEDRDHDTDDRGSRRRENKYERVHEINIPVQINRRENVDKVFRPRSLADEATVHNIEIETERPKSFVDPPSDYFNEEEERLEKRIRKSFSSSPESDSPKVTRKRSLQDKERNVLIPDNHRVESISLDRLLNPKQNKDAYKPDKRGAMNEEEAVQTDIIQVNYDSKALPSKDMNHTEIPQYKPIDLDSIYTISDEKLKQPVQNTQENCESDHSTESSVLSKTSGEYNGNLKGPEIRNSIEDESDNEHNDADQNLVNKQNQNSLTVNSSNTNKSKSNSPPSSPVGREVKVEKGQGCLEEDIFKDCWSDFSNTLQEVLNRLQELSSELGQSKLLATTPGSEDSSKVLSVSPCEIKKSQRKDERTPTTQKEDNTAKTPNGSLESVNSSIQSDNIILKSQYRGAPSSPPKIDRNSPIDMPQSPWGSVPLEIPLGGRPSIQPFAAPTSRGGGVVPPRVGGNGVFLNREGSPLHMPNDDHKSKERKGSSSSSTPSDEAERIPSHPDPFAKLYHERNDANQEGPFGRGKTPRPTTLFLGKDPQGSLLPELRKNSPVEALQEKFFRRSGNASPSSRHGTPGDVQYLPVELEDCSTVETPLNRAQGSNNLARSCDTSKLSPCLGLQSSCTPGTNETRPESSCKGDKTGAISEQTPPSKDLSVKVEFPDDSDDENDSRFDTPVSVIPTGSHVIDTSDAISAKRQNNPYFCKFSENENTSKIDPLKREAKNILNNLNLSREALATPLFPKRTDILSSYQPNIDSLESPESNLTDENELHSDEGIVEGKLSIPLSSFLYQPEGKEGIKNINSNLKDLPHHVDKTSDVTVCNSDVEDLKIPGYDVMGGEHLFQTRVGRPRVDASPPLSPAKAESCRYAPQNKKQCPSSFSYQDRGNAEPYRPLRREMGGVFTRSNKPPDLSKPTDSPPSSPALKSPSGGTQHYPYRTAARSRERSSTDPPVPSYVRQRSEPLRRYSGFAHVNSNNVKKMRDVWGTKQDGGTDSQPVQSPLPKFPVPPTSPMRPTASKRISDISSDAQQWRKSSPLPTSNVPIERKNGHRKRSPSPSPNSRRVSSISPSRPLNSSSTATRTPLQDYTRNASPAAYKSRLPEHLLGQKNLKSRSPSPMRSRQGKSTSPPEKRSSPPLIPTASNRKRTDEFKENVSVSSPSTRRRNKDPGRGPDQRSASANARPGSMPTRTDQPTPRGFRPKEGSPPNKNKSPKESSPASKAHQRIFKRFRNANLQPDSEAICFKEEEDKYTMVLDVEEYVPGEIDVLQDDKVLTIKGKVETKDSGDHVSVRTFKRTFNIPRNTREEDIDSALSEDGILTIFVPKKERIIKIELVD